MKLIFAVPYSNIVLAAAGQFHSRLDLDARPANYPMDTRYLPDDCRFGCNGDRSCRCAVIDGLIRFTRIIITGLGLTVGPLGRVSADALGHLAAEGPGTGGTSSGGGGGGGGGGNGGAACQAGAGTGGGAYGLAIAPSDMGYCAGDSRQASIEGRSCEPRVGGFAWELGSGGGHGLVQGGQGGGAVRVHTDVEVVIDGTISARGEDSACVDVMQDYNVLAVQPGVGGIPAEAPLLLERQQVAISQPGGGGGGGGTIWITSPRVVGVGLISATGGSANRSCDIVRVVSSGGSGGGGRIALDYLTSSTASLRVDVRGGSSRCTAGGAGTVFHSLRRALIVDNGVAIPMAGQPGNFGPFTEPPVLVSAYTPWTPVGSAQQAQRLKACAYDANYAQPFGCDRAAQNFSKLDLFVVRGAISEFPVDAVGNVVVESGAVLMPTFNSSTCEALGNVTVRTGGVLGCLGCAGSREAANDIAGCRDTCPSWNLSANRGGLTVDSHGKVMGINISIALGLSAMFGEDSWVAASEWQDFPQFSLVAGANVTVAGKLWMSSISISAGNILVQRGGWVGTNGMGHFSDMGPGTGDPTSAGGGGGGGHGGSGAQGCYDFSAGGAAYGDGAYPSTYGSGGGAGGCDVAPQTRLAAVEGQTYPLRQRPLPSSVLPANTTVRQLVRDRYRVRVTPELCLLRGIRNIQLDRNGEVDPAVPLSSYGTSCPSGYQGSSLPDWCCHGVACDCTIAVVNYHPGGRGGGRIELFAMSELSNDGMISSNGEGSGCQGAVGPPIRLVPAAQGSALPETVAFATGGGGAGGSVLVSAPTVSGSGSFQAMGGSVESNCSMTKSGGAGSGGRIAIWYQNIGPYVRAEAPGGHSDGCASGGAGTVYFSLNKTLTVDNQDPLFISAITPFPIALVGVNTTVISKNGAVLEFPQEPIWRAYVLNGGALIATASSSSLIVGSLIVASRGIVGCFDCFIAADAQNGIPGCNGSEFSLCPPYLVKATEITFTRLGRLRGYAVEISSDGFVSVDDSCTWMASDPTADSHLHVQSNFFRTKGHIRFSTIQMTGNNLYVGSSGWISGNALGFIGGHGPAAGGGDKSGGGGGGNGGNGAQGCSLASVGGQSVWNASDNVTSPWSMGSGGGQGGGNSASGGGRGGGRVRISMTGNITLLGTVSADGASTRCIGVTTSYYIRNRADKPFIAGSHGGGAGAGGSVWILASFIFGDGAVLARGGSSYCTSHLAWPGGGGGGGRISIITSTTRLLSLNLNASGGKSGWDTDQADKSGTSRISGCAAGGAGTIFISGDGVDALIVDNGIPGRLSAMTPFPIYYGMDKLVVRRGAILQFPTNSRSSSTITAPQSNNMGHATSNTLSTTSSKYAAASSFISTSSAMQSVTSRAALTTFVSTNSQTMTSSYLLNNTRTSSYLPNSTWGGSTIPAAIASSAAFFSLATTSITSPVATSAIYRGSTSSSTTLPVGTSAASHGPSTSSSNPTNDNSGRTVLSESTPPIIGQVIVDEQSAFVAVPQAQLLFAMNISIDRGGILGCLSCADSVSAQNNVPGCSTSCPSFEVNCDTLQVLRSGRIMGVDVHINISSLLSIQNESGFVASDFASDSRLNATAGIMDIAGFIRFSTVNISVLGNAIVQNSGRITSSALGFQSDEGPGAGTSSNLGGGGGGHGGSGDNGCQRTPTGAYSGIGGPVYIEPGVPPENTWLLGSGGGHGNALTWNSTVAWNDYQQLLSYPSGGYIACVFDRGCDDLEDAAHTDFGRKPAYVPTFEVRRRYESVYTVQNADALCWPRGVSVDHWSTSTVLTSALVPSHPRACPPGWSGSNLEGFCCQGKAAAPHTEHFDWEKRVDCDCSDFTVGQNPGGQGGGRVLLTVGNVLTLNGSVSSDGESTYCSGSGSNPGGAGSGGSVHVSALVITGLGSITARGGNGLADCDNTSAGGGGGGGYASIVYGISSAVDVSVSGGSTDCSDGRIGRFCDPVNIGDCNYTVLDDEFNSIYLGQPFWKWSNEPPKTCVQGGEAEISGPNLITLANFSAWQGRCWDVSVSRIGWLRIIPSNLINQWLDDTAHRLYVALPSHTPFDVSTHLQVMNNDSSCVMAGLFARGAVGGPLADCSDCNASASPGANCSGCQAFDWVTVGVLDSGEGSRLEWSTRGTTMQDVYGMRDRTRMTDVYLRLVKDGNSTFRAYWRRQDCDDWTPFSPSQAWAFDTLEVGLYAAQCEEYGNATADFEYFRDNSPVSLDKTFGWKGESGAVFESGVGVSVPSNATFFETAASFELVAKDAALANRSLVSFVLNSSYHSLSGLNMRVPYVMLRGDQKVQFTSLWSAPSSANFITSQRYVDNFGDLRDTEAWNGTSWTPLVTEFVVSVRRNANGSRYVFFVDSVERPALSVLRPSTYEEPYLYVFTLDPATFNQSAPLPPLNGSLHPPLDGSGPPHRFLITTAPDGGYADAYRVGLRRNGARSGEVQWRVSASAPDTLFYGSGTTPGMGGVITVQDPLLAHADLFPYRRRLLAERSAAGPRSSGSRARLAKRKREEARRPDGRTGSLRRRLESFYQVHNKVKLGHLDDMVREWSGREKELNGLLRTRYGADLESFVSLRYDEEAVPEGLFSAADEDIPLLNGTAAALDNETTILELRPMATVIDCGGRPLFLPAPPGGSTPVLLLVDMSLELLRCNFSAPGLGGAYAVVVHHSAVRFTDCAFVGGSAGVGGGMDADASFVDLRRTSFVGLGGGGGGGAARVGTGTVRLAGLLRVGGSPAAIHRLAAQVQAFPFLAFAEATIFFFLSAGLRAAALLSAPLRLRRRGWHRRQVYMGHANFDGCSADAGGAVWVAGGTWYCSDCEFQGNRAVLTAGALQVAPPPPAPHPP